MKNYILLLLCVLLFSGCGARGGSAPPGSSITIGSFAGKSDANTTTQRNSETVQVKVTDANGHGVINSELNITFNYKTMPVTSDITSLVTMCGGAQIVDSTFKSKTDDWGVYYLCIEYESGGGLAYDGTITVTSGDQAASAGLAVQ